MKDLVENEEITLDTSGTECPIPVLKARKLATQLTKDTIVKIIATDPLAEADFEHYSETFYKRCSTIKAKHFCLMGGCSEIQMDQAKKYNITRFNR